MKIALSLIIILLVFITIISVIFGILRKDNLKDFNIHFFNMDISGSFFDKNQEE